MKFLINSRFRGHVMTGSQRYATEIIQRLSIPHVELRPESPAAGASGHIWEQTTLASSARGNVLWSPCQTGPLSHKNHIVSMLDLAFVDNPGSFSFQFRMWYRIATKILAKNSRHIITISTYSKKRIAKWTGVPEEKITSILLGANDTFQPVPPQDKGTLLRKLGLPEVPYVLCVGSLEPRKNLARLIEAWRRSTPSRPPGVQLFLTGKLGDPKVYADLGIGQLPEDVRVTGYISDRDLPTLYGGARLFVYPSLYEGFGLPVLEAMRCGTPVVSSNATSLPEVGGDVARYFNPVDVDSIAGAIIAALDDHEWLDRAAAESLNHASTFSWDRCASEHELIFSRYLQGRIE